MLRNSRRRITISIEERNEEDPLTSTKERAVVVVDGRWKRPRFHVRRDCLWEKRRKKEEKREVVPVARRDKEQREREGRERYNGQNEIVLGHEGTFARLFIEPDTPRFCLLLVRNVRAIRGRDTSRSGN